MTGAQHDGEEVLDARSNDNSTAESSYGEYQRHGHENIFHRISSSVDFMMGSICSMLLTGSLLWFECIFHVITFPFQGESDSFTRVSTRNGQISMLYSHPDYECGYQTRELTLLSIFLLMLHMILYQLGGLDFLARLTISSLNIKYNPGFHDIIPNSPLTAVVTHLIGMLQNWLKASIIGQDSALFVNAVSNQSNEVSINFNTTGSIQDLEMLQNFHSTISLILPPIVLGIFLLITVILFLFGHLFFLCLVKFSDWISSDSNHINGEVISNPSEDESTSVASEGGFPLGPIHTASYSYNSSETISSILILFGLLVVFVLETILPWVMLGTGTYICINCISLMEHTTHESMSMGTYQLKNVLDWALFIPVLIWSSFVWWTIFCGVRMLRSGIYRSLQDNGIETETTILGVY